MIRRITYTISESTTVKSVSTKTEKTKSLGPVVGGLNKETTTSKTSVANSVTVINSKGNRVTS